MNKIDTSKPLELDDGTPMLFVRTSGLELVATAAQGKTVSCAGLT